LSAAARARRTSRPSGRASRNKAKTRKHTIGTSTADGTVAFSTRALAWGWSDSSSGSASLSTSATPYRSRGCPRGSGREAQGVTQFDEAREDLRRDPNSWPVIQELNRHGIFLVQFLWDHFRKENTSLFPTARKVLSADAIRKITEQISAP